MKKILSIAASLLMAAGVVSAQDTNYLELFPNEEGTQLVSKTYDGNGALQVTTTMTVTESYEYYDGSELELSFVTQDNAGTAVNTGKLLARYEDGNIWINMTNHTMSPCIAKYISPLTELSGDFLDYPDTWNDTYPFEGDFKMEGGRFTVQDKNDKRKYTSVEVYNRTYEGNEKIKTPAGEFDASKIKFYVKVDKDGQEQVYSGVEWYAVGAGIVRTEIYDENHVLQDYTVLTSLNEPQKRR